MIEVMGGGISKCARGGAEARVVLTVTAQDEESGGGQSRRVPGLGHG